MSSPAGPSRIGGLGPRHRKPPAVERRDPDEDYDEERERLTTNFNHPVSAPFADFDPETLNHGLFREIEALSSSTWRLHALAK